MANLTAEQLKAIQDWYAKSPNQYEDPNGNRYAATYSGGGFDGQGNYNQGSLIGYTGAQGEWKPGQQATGYDATGQQTGQWTAENPYSDSLVEKLAKAGILAAATAGAMGVGGSGFTGFGEAGAGLTGGPGSAGWGMDLGGAGLADTTYAANIGATGAAGAAGSGGAAIGAGGAVGAGGAAAATGGLLGSAPSWLGPALTLGGAVLGAKGNKNEQSMTKSMDPRLDGPVYGTGGLISNANNLMQQQMSPEGQAGWMEMQQRGRGLLGQPIAGNGFAQFAGRKL